MSVASTTGTAPAEASAGIAEAVAPSPMSFDEAVALRRSVRGFRPDPVPPALLRHVFELAGRSPSNCNIQPWRAYVASGAARDRVRERILGAVKGGVVPNPDFEQPAKFHGEYRDLQVEVASLLYGAMGVARDDAPGRMRAMLRNFELFDAPHVAFIGMDAAFGVAVALDVGGYIQTLMLAMTAHGIGSCPQASLRMYPNIVREEFGLGPEMRILAGISFGYEDESVAANRMRAPRLPLERTTIFRNE